MCIIGALTNVREDLVELKKCSYNNSWPIAFVSLAMQCNGAGDIIIYCTQI